MFKEFRTLDWAGVSVPLGVQKAHLEEELGITFRAFGAGWRYDWQSDGMLSRVVRPDGKEVSFAYDALGRRTEKTYEDVATHFVWDGNVPLHEWQEVSSDAEKTNITTWLFEQNTFIPAAKLAANGESFSIVSDYLGTPLQAFDNNGNKVWEQELDIFGRKKTGNNKSSFIPFKYQGQYEDVETGLYYNRFRYYEPNTGTYISQDSIGLVGGNPTLYAYVIDTNVWIDEFGLYSDLLGTGMGHHLIPRSVAKKLGLTNFSQTNSIAWYPNTAAGTSTLHQKLHAKLIEEGVPFHGSKFSGTVEDLFVKAENAYKDFTEKGFIIYKDVTPLEGLQKLKELYYK